MAQFEHPDTDAMTLNAVLFALSDPARRDMVALIASADAAATCQSVAPDMPKSTRSHHLKLLREAGVIRTAPRGRERVLSLRRADLDERWPGLLAAVLQDAGSAETVDASPRS